MGGSPFVVKRKPALDCAGRPVGLRRLQHAGKKREVEARRIFAFEKRIAAGRQSEFAAQGAERLPPSVRREFCDDAQKPIGRRAERLQPRRARRPVQQRRIENREERERRERVRYPAQAGFFGDERRGVNEFAGDEQVRARDDAQEIGVRIAQRGKKQIAQESFGAAPSVHERANPRLIEPHHLGAKGVEREAERGNFLAVEFGRGDFDAMPAAPQLARERDDRMEVTQRAEGGENDAGHGRNQNRINHGLHG